MNATLYLPQYPPNFVSTEGLSVPDSQNRFVPIPDKVYELLGCAPNLVDILACGPGYVAYSVFDHEGEPNYSAMEAVAKASGVSFVNDEDTLLRGAVLVVCHP